jgi:hypothetical protein
MTPTRTGFDPPKPVIPAQAGIHDFTIHQQIAEEKSWMPRGAPWRLRRHDVEITESHFQSHLV